MTTTNLIFTKKNLLHIQHYLNLFNLLRFSKLLTNLPHLNHIFSSPCLPFSDYQVTFIPNNSLLVQCRLVYNSGVMPPFRSAESSSFMSLRLIILPTVDGKYIFFTGSKCQSIPRIFFLKILKRLE